MIGNIFCCCCELCSLACIFALASRDTSLYVSYSGLLGVLMQRQGSGSNKSPRSSSQRVASPRKRQCSGATHDDADNGTLEEQDEDAEALAGNGKRSDSGRVDLQAVAAGL